MNNNGIITKCVGGVFTVCNTTSEYLCFSPKKLRYKGKNLIVGDKVQFDIIDENRGNITAVFPRKNKLLRPEIANVDVVFLVLACEPEPDWYLADKVLVNCFRQGIKPVVVVNKCDLSTKTFERACQNYGSICSVHGVSAKQSDSLRELEGYFAENTVCFAGQSAVGKTSLLNAFLPHSNAETGDLSQKTGRGKHTTRHSSVHRCLGGFLVDTCGFSLCEVDDISSADFKTYFDDIARLACGCKFSSCSHTHEPFCAVKTAVESGALCKERYERYVAEYNELKNLEKNKY